jgi:FkbM family methyltransferase
MQLLGRRWGRVFRALLHGRHYASAIRSFRVYRQPLTSLKRYVTMSGDYPSTVSLRTPEGPLDITLYTPDDLVTVNEIFCRNDYLPVKHFEVVVDFGSNIGISALYWLTRNERAFVWLYEPLPQNIERLKQNLKGFEGRYKLVETAVGSENGPVSFGWEPTGRYGGVGKESFAEQISVPCQDAADALQEVIAAHGRIDILKIDVEGLETAILERIPDALLPKISQISVERRYDQNFWPEIYDMAVFGNVTQFASKTARAPIAARPNADAGLEPEPSAGNQAQA